MKVLKFRRGYKKGLVEEIDLSFHKLPAFPKRSSIPTGNFWYNTPNLYSPEELQEHWKMAEKYLYKLIDFSEKDFTEEELVEARKQFYLLRHGPKARSFVAQSNSRLTSADVLYFLTSTSPARLIAKKFDITVDKIIRIRAGKDPAWEWEYRFVSRIKAIIRNRLRECYLVKKVIYQLCRINEDQSSEVVLYATSRRKCVKLRESIIPKHIFKKLVENKTLEIIYPIHQIEVL